MIKDRLKWVMREKGQKHEGQLGGTCNGHARADGGSNKVEKGCGEK